MQGFDPSDTAVVRIGTRDWTVGVVPWRKWAELELARRQARRPLDRLTAQRLDALAAEHPGEDRKALVGHVLQEEEWLAEAERATVAQLPTFRELVRWGVRAGPIPTDRVRESLAGESHEVLPAAVADTLCHAPLLMQRIAEEVVRFNSLSEDDLLGFTPPAGP